ncbi:DUF86 domain-containing protein [Methanosarcina sp. UBA289]|uniref:HepT-like ribonuclease domain-containing protein n=1 Tax=Methanosarcina sp. UBA289 TaxID=1915574 RepID=UPI0025D9EF6B|nr:DUF86 domain-containing protein [Methanosarcina sp. UBA289]
MEKDDFLSRSLVQDGTIRQIEIIGEATKNLSKNLRDKYSHIPWNNIAGMRDRLIHHCFGVDLKAVWSTVKIDIPTLKDEVLAILDDQETEK